MAQQTRKDPRAKVLSMTVRYKSATLDEFIEHHSHDVSCGGMFIKTPQPFTRGTLLKFEVRIAGDKKVMQGVGRVVWKRELAVADAEHPAGMGVSFIKLDEESRRLIDQLVRSRQGEASAFDAEREGTGVDAESTVGLGNDPLPASSSKAPASGPSFFPKGEPAQAPPPEDRTVMKQAAELLEEALREVDTDPPAKPKAVSLAPVGDAEEKEDTKPGRPSRSSESRTPIAEVPAAGVRPLAKPLGISSPKPTEPAGISSAKLATDVDMASVAENITARARLATESAKPHKPAPAPPPRVSGRPATVNSADSALERAGDSFQPKRQVSQKPSAPAQATSADRSSSGSGRALFWFLAVAACAGGTWWLWKPRPIAPPLPEAPAVELTQPKLDVPATTLEPATVSSASDLPSAATASAAEPSPAAPLSAVVPSVVTAAPSPSPSVVAPPVGAATSSSIAAAPATAATAPIPPKAVVARPKPKPASEQTANEGAAAPPSVPDNAPQNAAAPARPSAPPAPKPKPAAPATDSDNPY